MVRCSPTILLKKDTDKSIFPESNFHCYHFLTFCESWTAIGIFLEKIRKTIVSLTCSRKPTEPLYYEWTPPITSPEKDWHFWQLIITLSNITIDCMSTLCNSPCYAYPLLELTVRRHYVNSPCYVKYWNGDYNFESTTFSAK